MRKIGHARQHIKYLSCVLAVTIGLIQPCAALAVEEGQEVTPEAEGDSVSANGIKYITGFEALAEEDAYFPCMYKPSLEELLEIFPETVLVWSEGAEAPEEVEVRWECEEDFDATQSETYIFYPKWDENLYAITDAAADDIEIPSIIVEVPVESGIIKDLEGAKSALKDIAGQKSILAIVYLCDKYDVKESPSVDSGTIRTVSSGQSVQITDVEMGEYGDVWYQVLFYQNAAEYTGYVEREYLATSDEDFAGWEDTYIDLSAVPMMMAFSMGYPDVDQFPASYQNALYELKDKHPNWTFVKMDTGLDWNTVIAKEMGDKSLISSKTSGSWQNGIYGQGWSYASEGILKYYMDPRNFLSDPYIFQFEQLTYNESYHTTSSVQEVIKNSFMSSGIPGDSRTYAQAFTEIGQKQNVSPFHLAARVLQEQGTQGTSPLISGTYPGYLDHYNYFNVGASGKTNAEVITSGLAKAVELGWNTRFKSLNGGAAVIGANYITKGQDTVYLEKFNVSNGRHPNFTHQYMQNIQAPASEAANIRKAYNNAGALENSFVFKIPVYNNMPASACSKPETTDSITLNKTAVSGLEVNKTVTLIPYVNGSKVDSVSNMTFTSSNTSVATVDSQGKVTGVSPGTATISCTRSGANTAACTVTVVKANPSVPTPVLSPYTYREGLKLADIALPDGWAWEQGNTPISVGTFSYVALFTPADTAKYHVIKKEISFTVTKAIPNCQMPGRLEVQTGAALGTIALPSGFIWESSTDIELKEAGEYTFYVSYNPDPDNYYAVDHIPIIVEAIGKAPELPKDEQDGNNGSTSTGGNSGTTSGGSTSDGSTTSDSSTATGGNSGSTSSGSTSGGSTTSGSSTITGGNSGTTSSGSTSSGSTATGGNSGTTSSGSTTSGSSTATGGNSGTTSSGSTTSGSSTAIGGNGGTTSSGSTSGGSTATGGNSGTTSSGSTTSGSSTTTGGNSETTSGGSTSSGSTTSGSSTTTGGNSGTTSSGSTSGGNTTSGSSTTTGGNSGTTSSGSTSGGNTTSGSSTTTGSNSGTTSSGSISSGSTSSGGSTATVVPDSNTTTSNSAPATNSAANNSNPSANNTTNGSNLAADHNIANNDTASNNPSGAGATANGSTVTGQPDNAAVAADDSQNAVFKPSVTMHMEDTTILTTEKLQMAKEQNVDLVLDMGNSAAWSIDVDSVDLSAVFDVDMGITMQTENVPAELIAELLDGNKYLEFTLNHSGDFGFEPVLNIQFDPSNSGRYANLFYYNPEMEELEFICSAVIGENGVASFRMEHASSYIIIVSDSPMSGVPASGESSSHISWWVIAVIVGGLILLAVGGSIFFYRRKNQEDGENEDDGDDEYNQNDNEEDREDDESEDGYLEEEGYFDEEDYLDEDDDLDSADADIEEAAEVEKPDEEESDWIEDKDWHEPEVSEKSENRRPDIFANDYAEDEWMDDDEWETANEWVDDAEWEKMNGHG